MPVGGDISIRLSEVTIDKTLACHGSELTPGTYVLLSFSDSGHGMELEVMEHVFEPFFTGKVNGCEIGLSSVMGIVRKHGAHIKVSSSLGTGTTFRIYFRKLDKQ